MHVWDVSFSSCNTPLFVWCVAGEVGLEIYLPFIINNFPQSLILAFVVIKSILVSMTLTKKNKTFIGEHCLSKYSLGSLLGKDNEIQVARVPAPCSPMPDRYPWDTGTPRAPASRDQVFNCKDPPCSLLMSTNIIYNHVSTTRGNSIRDIDIKSDCSGARVDQL